VEYRISGLEDKIDIKGKNRKILRQKTQELQKEYIRTLQLYQKTKPANHGHQRRRRGASQRYMQYIQQNNSRKLPKS
jgi:hypothetical protein